MNTRAAVPRDHFAVHAHRMAGKFPFDRLVKFHRFEAIGEAMRDADSGATIKPVSRVSA